MRSCAPIFLCLKWHFFVLGLLAAICVHGEVNAGDVAFFSYAEGKVFGSTITREALEKSPEWLESEPNPPLSVRKAITLADAKRKRLVHDSDRFKWQRESAAVVFDDATGKSYWRVHYALRITVGGLSGPLPELDIYILMDGTLIDPKVTEDTNRLFPNGTAKE